VLTRRRWNNEPEKKLNDEKTIPKSLLRYLDQNNFICPTDIHRYEWSWIFLSQAGPFLFGTWDKGQRYSAHDPISIMKLFYIQNGSSIDPSLF
jgi:hypothetical protein